MKLYNSLQIDALVVMSNSDSIVVWNANYTKIMLKKSMTYFIVYIFYQYRMIVKCVEEELGRILFIALSVAIVWILLKRIIINAMKMLDNLNVLYAYKF